MARTGKTTRKVAKKTAGKAAKLTARKMLQSAAGVIRALADRAAATGSEAFEAGITKRPPIQVGIDVAVPIAVAWKEWMSSTSLPEGVHRIQDIERDGDQLFGKVDGVHAREWAAEITDDRKEESFAWRSVEGSDCAGLVTFHRLSDRLTRIELDLDVLPTNPAEAVQLSLHLADHRAEADLRRFKAHVEFINPDTYKQELQQNGSDPEQIVIASVDTYLWFAEAVNRLDLGESSSEGLPELVQDMTSDGAQSKTKGVLEGAKESLFGSRDQDEDEDQDQDGGSRRSSQKSRTRQRASRGRS